LKDATLGELTQMFGSEANPQGGKLWRSAVEGRSNVFVYYSGHGVPDLATRQPFLLPQDGNPNASESGYALQTLYRNLELVRQKIGAQRQLIVMIDACFTGETGRKGESLLAVSAPGFTPAKPRTGGGIVKLVATSGATPANWDERPEARPVHQPLPDGRRRDWRDRPERQRPARSPGPICSAISRTASKPAARRDSGREQAPEIDLASIALPVAQPVPAVARAVALARDEANWQRAKAAGERSALEGLCRAVRRDLRLSRGGDGAAARQAPQRRGRDRRAELGQARRLRSSYEDYLKGCGTVCAYRSLAEGYLGRTDASRDPRVQECDELAGDPADPDRREGVKGVKFARIDARAAISACKQAAEAQPQVQAALLPARPGLRQSRALQGRARGLRQGGRCRQRCGDEQSRRALRERPGQQGRVAEGLFGLYEQAAGTGNAIAMSNVGRMLQYGRGRARDEAASLALVPEGGGGGRRLLDRQAGAGLSRRAAGLPEESAEGLRPVPPGRGQGRPDRDGLDGDADRQRLRLVLPRHERAADADEGAGEGRGRRGGDLRQRRLRAEAEAGHGAGLATGGAEGRSLQRRDRWPLQPSLRAGAWTAMRGRWSRSTRSRP
jgi:hypothetical protein